MTLCNILTLLDHTSMIVFVCSTRAIVKITLIENLSFIPQLSPFHPFQCEIQFGEYNSAKTSYTNCVLEPVPKKISSSDTNSRTEYLKRKRTVNS
jgi:hypothetical protein